MSRRNAKGRSRDKAGLYDMGLPSPVPTLPEGYTPLSAALAPPADYDDLPGGGMLTRAHQMQSPTGPSESDLEALGKVRDELEKIIPVAQGLLRQLRMETRSARRI